LTSRRPAPAWSHNTTSVNTSSLERFDSLPFDKCYSGKLRRCESGTAGPIIAIPPDIFIMTAVAVMFVIAIIGAIATAPIIATAPTVGMGAIATAATAVAAIISRVTWRAKATTTRPRLNGPR